MEKLILKVQGSNYFPNSLIQEIPFLLEYKDRASQVALVVKNLPASAGDRRDLGSIPVSRRSAGGGLGNPLQYSGLENPMDRGVWWATCCGVTKNQTRLSD